MKIKKILGLTLCGLMLTSVTPVMAEGESFKIGTPIDLSTGKEVESLKAGQLLAYPVDIIADSKTVGYQYIMQYDTDVLSAGVVDSDLTDDQLDVIDSLGELCVKNAEGKDGAIYSIGETGRRGFTAYGNMVYNTDFDTDMSGIGWYDTEARALNESTPEFYALYTVKKDVDELNKEVIKSNSESSTFTNASSVTVRNIVGNVLKTNACAGAFKLVLDNSALNYWVQSIEVFNGDTSLGQLTEYTNADGSTEYAFPARVYATGMDSANITIKATVSDDEAGTKNTRTVTLADNVNIDLTGTVTDYASVN